MPLRLPPLRGLLFALLLIAGCNAYPRAIAGLALTDSWAALPLRRWLAEGRAVPEAIAMCRPPECAPGLAVGVFDLAGEDAKAAWAILGNPDPLVRALRKPEKPGKPRPIIAPTASLAETVRGFGISLAPADGNKRPAYGAALGRLSGDILRLVLVIGEEEAVVEETARRVAAEHLGS